jgi:hypothetical protein
MSFPAEIPYMMGKSAFAFNNEAGHAMETKPQADMTNENTEKRVLSPAAERALAEAEARRAEYRRREAALPREIGGRGGKEPVRYGDWEVRGLAADF